jgi:hypothetical protein
MVSFAELSASKIITELEHQYLKDLAKERYEFLYGDAYGLGYMLDPRYIGEKLSMYFRSCLEDNLYNYGASLEPNDDEKVKVFQQYTDFVIRARAEKVNNSFRYEMYSLPILVGWRCTIARTSKN